MKHAGPAALDRLEPLLKILRNDSRLREKSRGIFYRGSRAFLHFHEHGDEFFADLRLEGDFERFAATKPAERDALLRRIDAALGDGKKELAAFNVFAGEGIAELGRPRWRYRPHWARALEMGEFVSR